MLVNLGNLSLIIASVFAGLMLIFGFLRDENDQQNYSRWIRCCAIGQFVLCCFTFLLLIYLFLSNDFSVAYVAQHSNLRLPLLYKVTASWGAHEGSLLMWNLVLSAWTISLFRVKNISDYLIDKTFSIMGLLLCGFLLFTALSSSPFIELTRPLLNGADLNPVLQDPAMALHPPILYLGYVGFSVPFAYVIAMLWTGKVEQRSLRWIRPWVMWPWVFLTLGITLGSWWAYYELGWGGWWFWDPVENASFMPWIAATALLHSLAVTEKRGLFLHWTLLLSVMAFALSVLGTFLVRSGVLISVHAFASDPTRGLFILGLFALFVGIALVLYAFKTPIGFKSSGFSALSRESFLLINNLLLVGMLLLVMLGTLYPLIIDGLGLGKMSVGPPYFDYVMLYVCLPLLIAMTIGQRLNWKKNQTFVKDKSLLIPLLIAVLIAVLVFAKDKFSMTSIIGLIFSLWLLVTAFQPISRWISKQSKMSRSVLGMLVAHIGIAVFSLGVILTNEYSEEITLPLMEGQTVKLADYDFTLENLAEGYAFNYQKTSAIFSVKKDLREVSELIAEKRVYPARQTSTSEAGIDAGFFKDLYVTIGESLTEKNQEKAVWSFHLQVKPFIRWIWLGALLMALGGIIAIRDARYSKIESDK